MDVMELLKDVLQMIMFTIITGCGVAVVKKIMEFINKKIDEVQTTTSLAENEKLNMMIDQVQKIVYDIVSAVNQTYTNVLKSEGKFDKDSAEIAKDTAVDKAKELINEETSKIIEEVYGSLDSYLDVLIEATVNELKNKNKKAETK